jgi:hypothetical protein
MRFAGKGNGLAGIACLGSCVMPTGSQAIRLTQNPATASIQTVRVKHRLHSQAPTTSDHAAVSVVALRAVALLASLG